MVRHIQRLFERTMYREPYALRRHALICVCYMGWTGLSGQPRCLRLVRNFLKLPGLFKASKKHNS